MTIKTENRTDRNRKHGNITDNKIETMIIRIDQNDRTTHATTLNTHTQKTIIIEIKTEINNNERTEKDTTQDTFKLMIQMTNTTNKTEIEIKKNVWNRRNSRYSDNLDTEDDYSQYEQKRRYSRDFPPLRHNRNRHLNQ